MKKNKYRYFALSLALFICFAMTPLGAAIESPPISAGNLPPVAENMEFTTYRGVSLSGKLSAIDPEGDLITFQAVTVTRKGALELCEDGSFVYTPEAGKKGKDYFSYKAVDANGGFSQEATVIIKIEKQKTGICYSDMSGSGDEYAAVYLAENGIYTGVSIGNDWLFEPDREVSRGEFLAMCLNLSGTKLLSGVTRTGFSDDDDIPMWVKPYVSTALMSGLISGYDGDLPVFNADAPISFTEAAVALNSVLGVTDVAAGFDAAAPAWAQQAMANLKACKVLSGETDTSGACLTLAEAARLLVGAAKVIDARNY